MKQEIIDNAARQVASLKETLEARVILDNRINNLVNVNTGEDTGVAVVLHLSSRFTYDDSLLNSWKVMFGASEFVIKCVLGQLWVHFIIRPEK